MIRIPLSLLKRNYQSSRWFVIRDNKVLFCDTKDIAYGISTTFTRQELMQISSPHTQQLFNLLTINQKDKNFGLTPQNLQKAQQIMMKIEQTYPQKQQIHKMLAKSFLIQKNYNAAIRQYNKAWKLSPNNPQYAINIAICLIEAQNYYDAIKILDKQAIKHDNNSQINYQLATAYLMIQGYSQAIENFHKSYKKNNKLNQDFTYYAQKLKSEGNYIKAAPLFIKWLMHDCENEEVLNGLKKCFISSGRIEEAKELYNSLGEIQDYKSAVKHSLALFYFQIGQKDKAKEYLLQAIQNKPNNYQLNLYLSTIYIVENRCIEAIICLQKCLIMNPSDPNVLNSLGLVYTKLKQFQTANHFYSESVRLNQNDSMSWYGLGVSFIQRNEVQKGIKHLKKALQLDQRNYPALEKLGSTLHLLGDEKQAQILFKRAQMIKQQIQKL